MRPPWITVRGLLVAVAVVALLIPFPLAAIVFSIRTFALWIFLPLIFIWMCDSLGKGPAALVATMATVGAGTYGSTMGHRYAGPLGLFGLNYLLTPINLFGPIYSAWRLWRHQLPLAGEMLWAWVGLAWAVLIFSPEFTRMHIGASYTLNFLVEFARLTAALAVLLALYGKRPTKPESRWPHHLGWAVAECDVIVWGWYASSWLW